MDVADTVVPLNDLKRWSQSHVEVIHRAISRVVERGWYVLGPEVEAFEREFAAYCGVGHAVGVANGTDALELSLRALGIGPGHSVVTVANAGMYSTTAILSVGATPVYVDVDPDTLTMSPDAFERADWSEARAVVVTHLYGRLAEVERIAGLARRRGQRVVEDCAQAHGARRHGRRAGSFGDIAAFSFYPTKNLGGLGDGGAVVTSDARLATRVAQLRQYGWTSKYRADLANGRNSRLDELQAAVLRERLCMLDADNARRRAIAVAYRAMVDRFGRLPPPVDGENYVGHLFVIRTEQRDQVSSSLSASGVENAVHYPIPDYRQHAVRGLLRRQALLPETEKACAQVLTVPCFPELSDSEVERVAVALNRALVA